MLEKVNFIKNPFHTHLNFILSSISFQVLKRSCFLTAKHILEILLVQKKCQINASVKVIKDFEYFKISN